MPPGLRPVAEGVGGKLPAGAADRWCAHREKADIVIASCGGYPKDINLYQGIKTLLNMGQAVKPGGTMIFIAQCPDGGGAPDFFDWSRSLKTDSLDADLRAGFTIAGYIFYAGCEVIQNSRVLMLTGAFARNAAGYGDRRLHRYGEPSCGSGFCRKGCDCDAPRGQHGTLRQP